MIFAIGETLVWPPAPFAVTRDFGGTGSSTLEGSTGGSTPAWTYMNSTFLSGGTLYDTGDTVPASGGVLVYNGGVGGSGSPEMLARVNGTAPVLSQRFNARMRAMDLIIQLGGAYGAGIAPEDAVRTDATAILAALGHNRFVFAHKHYDAIAPHGARDHTRINRLMRLDHVAYPGQVENVALMFNKFPPADGADVTAQIEDRIPPSLQVDTAHPNTAGQVAIAERSYLPFKYAMEVGNAFVPHQEHFFDAPAALNTSGVIVGTIPHHPATTLAGSTFATQDPRFSAAVEGGEIVLRRANADPITNGYTDIALQHLQGGAARVVHQRVRIRDTTPSDARTYLNSQWMVREKLLSNVVNGGRKFSFALLFRVVSGDATTREIAFFTTGAGLRITLKSSNRFGCTIRDVANASNPVNLDSGTGANLITVASGWRAAFFCADTTTGVQIAKWVIDDNAATTNVPTADAALAIWPASTTQGRLFSASDAGSSLCDMEIGALWMAEDYVDWETPANRSAFRNSTTMRSVLTGTGAVAGVTPFLWMQGPAGNWSSGLNLAAPGDFWDAGIRAQMTTV